MRKYCGQVLCVNEKKCFYENMYRIRRKSQYNCTCSVRNIRLSTLYEMVTIATV